MPLPDATPTPPPYGIYGHPLYKYGDGYREPTDDGGYIIWKQIQTKNGPDWRPVQPVPASTDIEA